MVKFKTFEDILAWQKAKELAVIIYKLLRENKDYGFREQIQRASISVSNNIAEGFERSGDKEFRKFLYIAKGSCGEVRSMLHVGLELEYISKKDFNDTSELSIEISKMISGLIKTF